MGGTQGRRIDDGWEILGDLGGEDDAGKRYKSGLESRIEAWSRCGPNQAL